MKRGTRSNEAIEADIKAVEAYLNYIVESNSVSGLDLEIKRQYESYQETKKDSQLRALAKEVRVIVRETFSRSDLASYQSMLGMESRCADIELSIVMKRGKILNDDEFQMIGASIDHALSEGDALDIDVLNQMLLAYEKKRVK